jgi:hypothetical protein
MLGDGQRYPGASPSRLHFTGDAALHNHAPQAGRWREKRGTREGFSQAGGVINPCDPIHAGSLLMHMTRACQRVHCSAVRSIRRLLRAARKATSTPHNGGDLISVSGCTKGTTLFYARFSFQIELQIARAAATGISHAPTYHQSGVVNGRAASKNMHRSLHACTRITMKYCMHTSRYLSAGSYRFTIHVVLLSL